MVVVSNTFVRNAKYLTTGTGKYQTSVSSNDMVDRRDIWLPEIHTVRLIAIINVFIFCLSRNC